LGYVKPEIYPEIKSDSKIEYFTKIEKHSDRNLKICELYLRTLIPLIDDYRTNFNIYPISLDELKKANGRVENSLEMIKKYCPSLPSYQVSENRDSYTLSTFIGDGKEFFISPGSSGEREVLPPKDLEDFYNNKEVWKGNYNYTKITINAPSEKLKKDLWINPQTPLSIFVISGIESLAIKYPTQTTFFLVALLSFIIGGICGKICFGKFLKYALIGLSNVLTILGSVILVAIVKKEDSRFSKSDFIVGFFFMYLIFSAIIISVIISI